MANLQTLAFTDIVRGAVAAIQAGATKLLNFTPGSVLRAIVEAIAGVVLWLQGLIVYVLTLTRFATSVGADADSWGADFSFAREAEVAATGQVTFGRFTTTAQSVILFGTVLQTKDGTQTFTVDNNPLGTGYNAGLGGYVMGIGLATLTVNVTAATPGSGGNVLANTITSMGQGVPGVDTVTNASAFTNGLDAESDAAYKARFVLYIAALSKATKAAVASAIADVQQGLQYTLTENFDYNATYDPGYFYVVLDDGTGSPSSQLLTNVSNAIDAVRALGIRFGVFAPVVTTVNVTLEISTAPGFDHPTVVGQVAAAVTAFINGLGLGNGLPYTQVASVAYPASGHDFGFMIGDQSDILSRIKALLPFRWFPDSTPVLDALLAGPAWALSQIYALIQYAQKQTRIATATDGFLDLISYDFFGRNLLRRLQETDNAFRTRIVATLFRPKATRQGMIDALVNLTGRTPIIFEPARPADTGGYGIACGYGVAGGWGSLQYQAQAFITAFRPASSGIPNVAGYGSSYGSYGGGYSMWASLAQVTGAVTDADIYQIIDQTKAAGTRMWVRLQS